MRVTACSCSNLPPRRTVAIVFRPSKPGLSTARLNRIFGSNGTICPPAAPRKTTSAASSGVPNPKANSGMPARCSFNADSRLAAVSANWPSLKSTTAPSGTSRGWLSNDATASENREWDSAAATVASSLVVPSRSPNVYSRKFPAIPVCDWIDSANALAKAIRVDWSGVSCNAMLWETSSRTATSRVSSNALRSIRCGSASRNKTSATEPTRRPHNKTRRADESLPARRYDQNPTANSTAHNTATPCQTGVS